MDKDILNEANVLLNQVVGTKEDGIKLAGEILVKGGYVEPSYVATMLEREALSTTYMGNFIAIPHGTDEAKGQVIKTGISVVQVPSGVSFGSETAKVLIGIAGKGDDHLDILSEIAIFCSEEANVLKLVAANSASEIVALLKGGN